MEVGRGVGQEGIQVVDAGYNITFVSRTVSKETVL